MLLVWEDLCQTIFGDLRMRPVRDYLKQCEALAACILGAFAIQYTECSGFHRCSKHRVGSATCLALRSQLRILQSALEARHSDNNANSSSTARNGTKVRMARIAIETATKHQVEEPVDEVVPSQYWAY